MIKLVALIAVMINFSNGAVYLRIDDLTMTSEAYPMPARERDFLLIEKLKLFDKTSPCLYQFNQLCTDSDPIKDYIASILSIDITDYKSSWLEEIYAVIQNMTETIGAQYAELGNESKIYFCILRGLDSYLKDDYIATSAFFLEARQMLLASTTLKKTDRAVLPRLVSYIYRNLVLKPLMPEDKKIDAETLMIHLKKISQGTKSNVSMSDPFFLLKKSDEEIDAIKSKNEKLFGHSVYLSIQEAAFYAEKTNFRSFLLNNINFKTVFDNIGFFEQTDQSRDRYRELGQRLFLATTAIGTKYFEQAYMLLINYKKPINANYGDFVIPFAKNIYNELRKQQYNNIFKITKQDFINTCALLNIDTSSFIKEDDYEPKTEPHLSK